NIRGRWRALGHARTGAEGPHLRGRPRLRHQVGLDAARPTGQKARPEACRRMVAGRKAARSDLPLNLAARAAASGAPSAAAGKAVPTAASAATTTSRNHGRHLLAGDRLVKLLVEPALAVGALLRDVRDSLAPVGRRIDDFLVDRHPRPVARTPVGADPG